MQSAAAFTTTTTATRATSSAFASGSTRRTHTTTRNFKNTNIIPGVKMSTTARLRSSSKTKKTKIPKTKIIRSMSPMPDADEDEGSVLDLPEEYVRAVPSRRPDIFPDLQEIKQPMPNPLPGDPEMPDEEEEEQERKENPGEPGEDEEEDENGEKITKKERKRREKERENEE